MQNLCADEPIAESRRTSDYEAETGRTEAIAGGGGRVHWARASLKQDRQEFRDNERSVYQYLIS